jgi:hypothetical protein
MKIAVELNYDVEFAVCYDEEPGKIYDNRWVETLEEAVVLLEEARDTHPDKEWHIRVNVNNVY